MGESYESSLKMLRKDKDATHEVTKQLERDCQQIIGVVNVLLRGLTCLSVAVGPGKLKPFLVQK